MERDAQRASIKRPITCPESTLTTLRCYPCRKFPLNSCKSLLFHGGDTGSIPVRDATNSITYKKSRFHRASIKLTRCLANAKHNHLDNLAVRFASLIAHCLNVCVQDDADRLKV